MESAEKTSEQVHNEKKIHIEYTESKDGKENNSIANTTQVIMNQSPYSSHSSDYSLGLLSITTSLIALLVEIIDKFGTFEWMPSVVASFIEIILLIIFIILAFLVLIQIWGRFHNKK